MSRSPRPDCPLQTGLFADHVAVLRPRLSADDLKAGVTEAFHHIDKPNDYELDFNISTRMVCTELIYRIVALTIAVRLSSRLSSD